MKQLLAVGTLALASLSQAQAQTTPAPAFGTYQKPFAADSLWNSYPVNPVFDTWEIPATTWNPAIQGGAFSSGIFEAKATDGPMLIYPVAGATGVVDTDTEMRTPTYTIPHWPPATVPATGGDGHADIIDASLNRIYSFSNLKKNAEGKWTATRVSWTPLTGSGWGDPAHYYQGARAAGPAPTGGMIRIAEANDGKPLFEHALSMSLDFTGLLAGEDRYTYPATAADTPIATKPNTGRIPEGARVMLPPNFDLSKITDARLLKVARTLMKYGAYVVDRNDNTPFVIYVEIGAPWSNSPPDQLNLVRKSLRRVLGQSGHIDGNGQPRVPETRVNLLSLRGAWTLIDGVGSQGVYDTFSQSLVWGTTTTRPMTQINYSNWGLGRVANKFPKAPKRYKLYVESTGGTTMSMTMQVGTVKTETAQLGNGQSQAVVWPDQAKAYFTAKKPVGGPASLKARLIELPAGE
ncbi:Atrophin-1 multi-domain protein [Massilia sp. CCM 8734]|uniref:Atrophin-1 multi-domain protein n=1 Tax=Massilia sp. CCM 8734 TaxID=2609283 RepID=UPI001423DD53|nr:Atrophin-1 multi-domain protein [Massilia sp. CCM 8734]NHZ98270.1 Atrophin-1 multi-domain protein [Massilia sp. CCM 8734]